MKNIISDKKVMRKDYTMNIMAQKFLSDMRIYLIFPL